MIEKICAHLFLTSEDDWKAVDRGSGIGKRWANPTHGLENVLMFLLEIRSLPHSLIMCHPIPQGSDRGKALSHIVSPVRAGKWERIQEKLVSTGRPQPLIILSAQKRSPESKHELCDDATSGEWLSGTHGLPERLGKLT
jgi:hypothetical protein